MSAQGPSFQVVTIFPEIFASFLATSLVGKAVQAGQIRVSFTDPRDFTEDRHRSVDDTPFGGGGGMVMKVEPLVRALESLRPADPATPLHRVLLTPQGARLGQSHLLALSRRAEIALVCGRYEGFDERVRSFVDEELSLGDFVLNGGEVAAMAIIDGVARLVPGVLGNAESVATESHGDGLLEYPQYTRPREFRGLEVPDVLVQGDHEAIRAWRRRQMLVRTEERRPDLWRRFSPTPEDLGLLEGQGLAGRTTLALLHHPVHDRDRRVVTTAITNLDLHDIARSCRTYGLGAYFVVTPLTSQQELVWRIVHHWRAGYGATHNPHRGEALSLLDVASSLEQVVERVTARHGARPLVVATTASRHPRAVPFAEVRRAASSAPLLLLFGTGWGLTAEVLEGADLVLEPLCGPSPYNHLAVRSAAAIVLDRLLGLRE